MLSHNTGLVRDGLVFYYDMGNTQKSWKGKPLTNYYGDISTSSSLRPFRTSHFWDGYSWLINNVYSHPGVEGPQGVFLGLVYKHTSGALDSTWSGNSYGYVLKDIAATPGNSYTMSSWVYMSADCNIDTNACSIEGATTINIAVSGYPSSYNMSNKGTWQQLARGAVSDGNDRWLPNYPQRIGVTNGSFTGFYMWGGVQVEDGTSVSQYAGSNTNFSRSNTQAILDITGSNTVTANSLTYDADGNFSYNGTSNYISAPLNIGSDPLVSVNLWIKRTASFTNAGYWGLGGGALNNGINGYTSVSNKIGWDLWGQTTFHTGVDYPLNEWVNVCWVKTSTSFTLPNLKIYINGLDTPLTTTARNNSTSVNITSGVSFGRLTSSVNSYHAPGLIGIASVYNRILSSLEVKQNFEALRDRYGI